VSAASVMSAGLVCGRQPSEAERSHSGRAAIVTPADGARRLSVVVDVASSGLEILPSAQASVSDKRSVRVVIAPHGPCGPGDDLEVQDERPIF
jgi:hypothetical protein